MADLQTTVTCLYVDAETFIPREIVVAIAEAVGASETMRVATPLVDEIQDIVEAVHGGRKSVAWYFVTAFDWNRSLSGEALAAIRVADDCTRSQAVEAAQINYREATREALDVLREKRHQAIVDESRNT